MPCKFRPQNIPFGMKLDLKKVMASYKSTWLRSASKKLTCVIPILALLVSQNTDAVCSGDLPKTWGEMVHSKYHLDDEPYRATALTREGLNEILALPNQLSDAELTKLVRPLAFKDNPIDPVHLYRRTLQYVLTIKTVSRAEQAVWPNLAFKRFAYLRDLFDRISSVSLWTAKDYSYDTGPGQRTFVFEGKREEVLVIRGYDGAIFRGPKEAMTEPWSDDFYRGLEVFEVGVESSH
jgi:hypothetical protein